MVLENVALKISLILQDLSIYGHKHNSYIIFAGVD